MNKPSGAASVLPDPFLLLLATLAVYRVSFAIAVDTGPSLTPWEKIDENHQGAFMAVRTWIYNRWPNSILDEGFNCPLCISFWLSIPAALLLTSTPAAFLLVWLGMAGAIVVIHNR